MIDFLGHAFYALIIVGQFFIARKLQVGWLFMAAGATGWLVLGVVMEMISIWVWNIFFVAFNLYGWRKWRRCTS